MDMKLLNVEDIAKLLHRTVRTVRADVTRRPETLPPRLEIEGSRRLLWLESDVAAWLEERSAARRSAVSKVHRLS